jgi:hypothetical protein
MSASAEVAFYRVFNNAPTDDFDRPYYPDWYGDQLQTFVRWPGVGVHLLLTQEPTPPELIAQIKERSTHG